MAKSSTPKSPAKATLKKHPHPRVNRLDPSFKTAGALQTGSRLKAASPSLPASVLPAGNWSSLGPQPIHDEKTFNGPAPTSDFGPTSGRVTSLVTDPNNGQIVYAGTAGGGVWKSTDGGATWATTMDNAPNLAIGALAIDAAGTTIYAATGEDNGNADAQWGAGILRSIDSGATWTQLGSGYPFATGTHIGGIAVDRTTSLNTAPGERVIIATDRAGAGGGSGLWISNDSGNSWGSIGLGPQSPDPIVSGASVSGDFIQVLQDPVINNKFWAVATDFCQTELGDVYTSTDSGSTWTRYALELGGAARIAIGVGPLNTAYAAVAGSCGSSNIGNLAQLRKTTDGGQNWGFVGDLNPPDYMSFPGSSVDSQGWYDNVVAVDPTNPNNAVFGGIDVVTTTDGGNNFNVVGNPYSGGNIHPDFHALAFMPGSSDFYAGNDGGIWESPDLGNTWNNKNGNLNTIQFYNGTSPDASHIVGGSQDNGTEGILPGSPGPAPSWQQYLDGDGGSTLLDPTPGSTTIYATTAGGGIWQGSYQPPASPDPNWPYDTFNDASPCPNPPPSPAPAACNETTAFVAPLLMDQTSPSRLLTATTRIYQTTTGGVPAGTSWSPISGSLATGPAPAGRADFIATIAMGTTANTKNTVFAGSYYGALYETTNANAANPTWTSISNGLPAFTNPNHVPGHAWISGIAFNESNPSEIWVTIGGINVGHVWRSANGGSSWSDLSGTGATGISASLPVNGIIYDPTVTASVFIATDLGVVACQTCSGATPTGTWATLGSGLPHVAVDAITENANRDQIVAWTHGRGAWIVPVGPVLDVAPTQLTFAVGEGGSPPGAQNVTVTNDGVGTLHWAAAPNPAGSWLNLPVPSAGMDGPKASTPVSISVNASGQPAGTQHASVIFTNSDTGATATVSVTLVVPPFPGRYQPVAPYRILDTRFGPGLRQKLQQGETRTIAIAGQPGSPVPAINSATPPTAVVMNVTVTNPTATSYLTVFPTGVTMPTASNLNFNAGQTVPNLVEVALGPDGNVNVFNH
ncbi:MAG: hypothetical protein E6I56_03915, partial [Chloroflexi bacterium]